MNWDSALRASRVFALLVTTALALAVLGSPGVARAQGYNVVYSFAGLPDGAVPQAALIQGIDGNFYGTTAFGGRGLGTVFQVTPDGTETIVYAFTDSPDARFPAAALIQGIDGNFYGTTPSGGNANLGTVFQVTPDGTETILHSFAGGPDGAVPKAALVQGIDGNFYGTTESGGGLASAGTVFKVTPNGTVTVYSFAGVPDGAAPQAALIQGTDGNFYGTTARGGRFGTGSVFRVTPDGTETILYSFGNAQDGGFPAAPLIQGTDGNFYGTTAQGGSTNSGTVFQVTPDGSETVLYAFNGGPDDGATPLAALIQGADGNFYGTTQHGGRANLGTVFLVTPDGTETILHAFTDSPDARFPAAALIQATDGSFYGTTPGGGAAGQGTIFQITPLLAQRNGP